VIDLDGLSQDASQLEPLSPSALKVAGVLADEEWTLADLVHTISFDQALTTRVLRIANAAAYRGLEPVTSVETAVSRLGASAILRIVVGVASRQFLGSPVPELEIEEGALWRHSVASALAAEFLDGACAVSVPPEVFPAALLHDLGRLLLARYVEPETLDWLRRAREVGGESHHRAEVELLGVDHAALGGLVAQSWGLPPLIVAAIQYHHEPELAPGPREARVCDVVCVADALATAAGYGLGVAQPIDVAVATALDRLELGANVFGTLRDQVAERAEEFLESFEV